MDALVVLLLVLVGGALLSVLFVVVAMLLGVRAVKQRNRVSPEHPSDAPVSWLSAPSQAARLHRRLRSAVTVARMIADRHAADPLPVKAAELATELEQEAVSIDRRLTVVSRLAPRARRPRLAELADEVARIEDLAGRLSMLDAEAAKPLVLPHHGSAMDELARQLDALEAARAELEATESEAGLA